MKKVFLSSFIGTLAMTAYSYFRAYQEKEQMEEPKLLGKMVQNLKPELPKAYTVETGWLAHLGIGYLLTQLYAFRWRGKNPGLKEGLKVGVPTGLAALAWWTAALKLHPNPPQTDLQKHRQQLFTAHLIFGVVTALVYNGKKKSE